MKKSILLLISLFCILSFPIVSRAYEPVLLDTVNVIFDIPASEGAVSHYGTVQLYDGTYFYEVPVHFSEKTNMAYASFNVVPYYTGKIFTFGIGKGFESVTYYTSTFGQGEYFHLQTYSMVENGFPVDINTFHMSVSLSSTAPAAPQGKRIEYYKDFVPRTLTPEPTYYNGLIYVPAAAGGKSIGLSNIEYDIYSGKITYWMLDKPIVLYRDSTTVSAFGNTYTLESKVITINEIPYIPLLSFAAIMEANVIIQDEPDHINVVVSNSEIVNRELQSKEKSQYVNSADLSSDTDYLIWVSKADFKVRVYKGSKNNWSLVRELNCSIGKDSSPTCTGTYKFYERIKKWEYDKYYVGPVMRFNGGYAIHSTLKNYDDTDYDNRVGMKLSAGCVRLQPKDMDWLFDLIPLKTTVHVTNE